MQFPHSTLRTIFSFAGILLFLTAKAEDPEFLVPKNVKTITYSYFEGKYGGPRDKIVNTYDRNGWLTSTIWIDGTTGRHSDSFYYFYDLEGRRVKELFYGIPHPEKKQDTTITWKKYFYYDSKGQQVFLLDTNWNNFYGYPRRNILHDSIQYNDKGIKTYEHAWFVAWDGDPAIPAAESELHNTKWTVQELNGTYIVTSIPKDEKMIYDKLLRMTERITYNSEGEMNRKYEYVYGEGNKLKAETDYTYLFLWGKHSVTREVHECNEYGFKIRSTFYSQAEGQKPQDPQTYEWNYVIANGVVTEIKETVNYGGPNAKDQDRDDYLYTYEYY